MATTLSPPAGWLGWLLVFEEEEEREESHATIMPRSAF
jgi:hypothetical protein